MSEAPVPTPRHLKESLHYFHQQSVESVESGDQNLQDINVPYMICKPIRYMPYEFTVTISDITAPIDDTKLEPCTIMEFFDYIVAALDPSGENTKCDTDGTTYSSTLFHLRFFDLSSYMSGDFYERPALLATRDLLSAIRHRIPLTYNRLYASFKRIPQEPRPAFDIKHFLTNIHTYNSLRSKQHLTPIPIVYIRYTDFPYGTLDSMPVLTDTDEDTCVPLPTQRSKMEYNHAVVPKEYADLMFKFEANRSAGTSISKPIKNRLLEYCAIMDVTPPLEDVSQLATGSFLFTVSFGTHAASKVGQRKKDAQFRAYDALWTIITERDIPLAYNVLRLSETKSDPNLSAHIKLIKGTTYLTIVTTLKDRTATITTFPNEDLVNLFGKDNSNIAITDLFKDGLPL